MGLLVNGEWKDQWYDTSKTGGKFVRSKSQFENQINNDENAEFIGVGIIDDDGLVAPKRIVVI